MIYLLIVFFQNSNVTKEVNVYYMPEKLCSEMSERIDPPQLIRGYEVRLKPLAVREVTCETILKTRKYKLK